MANIKQTAIASAVKSVQKDVAVYIGRFNPFHLGHAHVLYKALASSKLVIVLVGSSGRARNLKNPFTFAERKAMIERWAAIETDIKTYNLQVIPLRDFATHSKWISTVQQIVHSTIESVFGKDSQRQVTLVGSDRDHSTKYLNWFPQWQVQLADPFPMPSDHITATSVRHVMYESAMISTDFDRLRKKLPNTTIDFLWRFAGTKEMSKLRDLHHFVKSYRERWSTKADPDRLMMLAERAGFPTDKTTMEKLEAVAKDLVPPYAPTFMTADAVVIQSGHVLVVERGAEPGKGLWALPGGFVNQRETIKDASVRELIEETGVRLADGKRALEITESMLHGAITGKEIFDDPFRSERGRTITVAYRYRLDDNKPLPKVKGQNVPAYESNGKDIVETANAFWLPLERALEETDMWFEDHLFIVEWAVSVKD